MSAQHPCSEKELPTVESCSHVRRPTQVCRVCVCVCVCMCVCGACVHVYMCMYIIYKCAIHIVICPLYVHIYMYIIILKLHLSMCVCVITGGHWKPFDCDLNRSFPVQSSSWMLHQGVR